MNSITDEIAEIRRQMGDKLLILGHHYQRTSVLQHADQAGDSLELARYAGKNRTAEKIVFCGVRFMAESADILTEPDQKVYMPATEAGCPMANMADAESMSKALEHLGESESGEWIPIVYVNSSAEVKSCCGEYRGSTCTSGNSVKVFKWALDRGEKILFLPDEHLGWNTACDLGIGDDGVLVYDPSLENGGLDLAAVKKARVIVWKGYCIVHQAFTVDHVKQIRDSMPAARIIVHPETPKEVVRLCDAHGSTSQIIKYVDGLPDGASVVIGTELNLIDRLAEKHRGRLVVKALAPSVCANMARTNEKNLLDLLKEFRAENEVHVPEKVAEYSRVALSRMLEIG